MLFSYCSVTILWMGEVLDGKVFHVSMIYSTLYRKLQNLKLIIKLHNRKMHIMIALQYCSPRIFLGS